MINNLQKLNQLNQLLSSGQAIQVGPTDLEQPTDLIDPTPRPGLLGNLKQRGQTFITRLGGISPADQPVATQAQLDEARFRGRKELASRLSDAFLGKDIGAGAAQRQERQLAMIQKENEEKRQKLVEDFFKDPKYKNMVKIGGFDFAFKQQQADIERSEEQKANQAFIDSVKGTEYEGLIDVVGFETARDAYIANELKTQKIPADLQKLETLTQLRQRVIDDPSYTEDQYQQDATLLGVNQSFLKGKQEFITEYAKQLRGMKDRLGKPLYKDENEINELAKQAYDIYFPKEPTNTSESNEEPIDLGTLGSGLFPPRD